MQIQNILLFILGVGVFIFGIIVLSNALKNLAGGRIEKIIGHLTGNVFKGVLVGALSTGIIQSSSAVTVMTIGFVNSGVMTLGQAAGIIMGANIGTTVTAQILKLTGISNKAGILGLINTQNLAIFFLVVGIIMFFIKNRRTKVLSKIFFGISLVFIGMELMQYAVEFLKTAEWFSSAFTTFTNPLYGILAGTVLTGIIQSSSASVAILQAVASSGVLTFSAAIPIIMGQNIGTCVTALLSSIGTNANAKRTAMLHLYFNLIGTIIFMPLIYILAHIIQFKLWDSPISLGGIADFHLTFNLSTTLILLPFTKQLVALAQKSIPDKAVKKS